MDQPLPRWKHILPLLTEFQSHLAASVPKLEIKQAADRESSNEEYKTKKPRGFPQTRGVYLLFDSSETLLYVGLATYTFDTRVWSHDGDLPRRYVDIIEFDPEHCFLAPALELFLISRLSPPHNKQHTDHYRI